MSQHHDNEALRASLASMSAEVLRLQGQVDAMHCSDINSLRCVHTNRCRVLLLCSAIYSACAIHRRAYKTLCQHVQELHRESNGVGQQITALETHMLDKRIVQQEVWLVCMMVVWRMVYNGIMGVFDNVSHHDTTIIIMLTDYTAPPHIAFGFGDWLCHTRGM